jgi:DNA-binding beta-propeller fold protein YncE
MDEPWLHELLERAIADEPPIGPVAHNSLRAGLRRRRHRRVQGGAACAAAVAVIGAGAVAVTGAPGTPAADGTNAQTVYVLGDDGTVTPISTATNTPGEPIKVGRNSQFMALTPNGKTLYVASEPDTVTPIATATDTPGKPVKVGDGPALSQILFTPDGQTAYVATYSGVTPISTATNTPEKPITGTGTGVGGPDVMAITPDGKTLYVASGNTVIPVSTATNTPGKPIQVAGQEQTFDDQIIITPDGSTLYVFGVGGVLNQNGVITPVSTATNTPGQPISVVADRAFAMAMTPDGSALYVAAGNGQDVVPISTATNTPGPPINVAGMAYDIAVTPDGQTAYVASQHRCRLPGRNLPLSCGPIEVTPISTATNTPGTPVKVTADKLPEGNSLAITPDGKTIYIISGNGSTVTPITIATNTAGKPVNVKGAQEIVITPSPVRGRSGRAGTR